MSAEVIGTIGVIVGLLAGVFAGRCERRQPWRTVRRGTCQKCTQPAVGVVIEEFACGQRREVLCRKHIDQRLEEGEMTW